MAEKPIIFSGPMVRAILDGRKTMTRRILKPQPKEPVCVNGVWYDRAKGGDGKPLRLPYAVGDRLWVRETWAMACELDENDNPASEMLNYYRADGEPFSRWLDPDTGKWRDGIKWRSPIHMPRWASRITLIVTAVKVERVQDICGADTIAEGVQCDTCEAMKVSACHDSGCFASRQLFRDLWSTIHGPGAWDRNDWVAAISFERVNAGKT